MTIRLFLQALLKCLLGILLVGLLLFLPVPLVLGSLYAFAVFLLYPFLIARRIRDEEALLEKELDGYSKYQRRVRYRLIPFVW